jgi:hypothetical protein
MGLKRPVTNAPVATDGGRPLLDDFFKGFPVLVCYLTDTTYEDGTARVVSTLSIFSEDGAWKCCLRDRDNARVCWAAGDSPEGALLQMESHLAEDRADWRRDRFAGPTRKGKK